MNPESCFHHAHRIGGFDRKSRSRIVKRLAGDVPEVGHLFFGQFQVSPRFVGVINLFPCKKYQAAQSFKGFPIS